MKCVLPGSNVKVLGRAVQSLAKFGEEIHLAALPEGLSLRAVNSCRSAYASFLLSHLCFLHYEHRRRGDGGRLRGDRCQGDDVAEETFRCRISVKAMLSVFRATGSLDKAVEQCRIILNPKTCRLIIQMRCFRGVTTTRHLCFSDVDNVEASFSKSGSPNELRAPAR
ncbi:cell cycle checkpoint control protein RAD9A-like [Petromyzon marinus]